MTAAAPSSRSTKVACAAPRDNASIPAAPEPANRSSTRRVAQVRFEDREERLLDPVAQRPRRVAGRLEPDPAGGPGDDPAGVSRPVTSPLAGSPAATRRSQPSSSSAVRAGRGGAIRPVAVEQRLGMRPRPDRQLAMLGDLERGDPQAREPALGETQDVALLAQLEVLLGEREAVVRVSATARRRAIAISSVESETRTQNDSTVPRPTRPRSWWSWARPNRSAPSMTIIVAAGTSTPTSTTVVPTRTSRSPSRNRRHLGVALGRLEPAMDHARPGAGRAGRTAGPPRSRRRPRHRRRRRPPR